MIQHSVPPFWALTILATATSWSSQGSAASWEHRSLQWMPGLAHQTIHWEPCKHLKAQEPWIFFCNLSQLFCGMLIRKNTQLSVQKTNSNYLPVDLRTVVKTIRNSHLSSAECSRKPRFEWRSFHGIPPVSRFWKIQWFMNQFYHILSIHWYDFILVFFGPVHLFCIPMAFEMAALKN